VIFLGKKKSIIIPPRTDRFEKNSIIISPGRRFPAKKSIIISSYQNLKGKLNYEGKIFY